MWSSAGGRRQGAVSILAVLCVVLSCASQSEGLSLPQVISRDPITLPQRDDVSLRLPNDTIPIHYDLHLTTRIDAGVFVYSGQVDIVILCVAPTSTVVLHSRVPQISTVTFKSGTVETAITNFSTDEATEFLTIQLNSPLVKDQRYTLSITFVGDHSEEKEGWYRASYTNDAGEEVWFATSRFEAPNARAAFPCYDEPDKKATFAIQITNNVKYHALSNMNIENYVVNADGTATTTFNTTVAMSTYLLGFVVSDFESNCKLDARDRETCVYTRPNAIQLSQWGLDTAVQGLELLESLLNVEFALPKMDHVAISDKDYQNNVWPAVENWGLAVYKESYLLIDESDYAYNEKKSIGTVILQELAHNWFGNLVTPKWWTYAWLNEGFGTLFSYYVTDKIYPDMRLTDLMVVDSVHSMMGIDAWDNARPMTHYGETKANLLSIFNYVSYNKAGTVLRMIMLALGEETFFAGLTYYLEEMAYKNAVAEDLFEGLQKAIDEAAALPDELTIKTIMDSWTLQGGYPLITATRESGNKVTLKQNKFKINDPNTPQSDFYIPITFTEGSRINFNTPATNNWFRGDAAEYEISINNQSSWYILNSQQSAYYRVNYDENNWRQLALALRDEGHKDIHVLNRAALLDDSFDLALNGRLDVTIAFDIFKYLENEVDYIPWAAAEEGLMEFYNKIKVSDGAEAFNERLANMMRKMYLTYGVWSTPEDVYFTHLARNFAIRWACEIGLEECQTDASEVMALHFHNRHVLDRNYDDIIACAGFHTMNETDYLVVMGQVDGTGFGAATREQSIDMLLCTYNPDFMNDTLGRFLDAEPLYTQAERVYIMKSWVSRDIKALEIVLNFMAENSDYLQTIMTADDITQVFMAITSASYSERLFDVIHELAHTYEGSINSEAVATIQAQLIENLAWMNTTGNVVVEYFLQVDVPVTPTPEPDGASTIIVSSVLLIAALFVALVRV